MCRRSTGSPAFLVPHLREGIGKLVGAIPRVHAGTVAGPTGEGRAAGRHEARHDRRGRTLPSRDDARDEPPVLGDVDRLALPDPREHVTRMMTQIPHTYYVRIHGRHAVNVSQFCGHKLTVWLGAKSCSAAQLEAEMIGANRRISGGPVRSGRATKTVLTPRSASSR